MILKDEILELKNKHILRNEEVLFCLIKSKVACDLIHVSE